MKRFSLIYEKSFTCSIWSFCENLEKRLEKSCENLRKSFAKSYENGFAYLKLLPKAFA